eukprot:TRINITY_DN66430_c0_g1_i1.p1 TRINITY_DN66430_c0_g1~~TRINITY_DN66430_c0_g1_i1.p1  ORF type:complete len:320 (-),score=43.41 TRINITY_DN66430_c0_g1_i1:175-1134(-)
MLEPGLSGAWHCVLGVAFATLSAAATVIGMLLQKLGVERNVSTVFRLGVFTFAVVKPGAQIIALYFAPISLVAPLASVTILLNVAIVPCCRSEQLSPRSIWSGVLLVVGCVGTTVAGPHHIKTWSYPELMEMAKEKLILTLVVCALVAFSTLRLVAAKAKTGCIASWPTPSIVVASLAPAAASALNNVLLKILLTGLALGVSSWLMPMAALVACSAFLQVWSTSVGVELFDMLKYVPVQTAEQILVTTVYSMYVFDETPSQPLAFLVCSLIVTIGVLLSQGNSIEEAGYRKVEGVSEFDKAWIRTEPDVESSHFKLMGA